MNLEDLPISIESLTEWGWGLLGALFIFLLGWVLANALSGAVIRTVKSRGLDEALGGFLSQMVRWTVLAGAVVTALGTLGFEVTSLAAMFASAGIAVGLALQGSLANFAAGVMILIFRPFTVGDMITAGGHTGVVQEIGLFATIMHSADGQKIIVPNGGVTGGSIINLTTLGSRRADVPVGVAYGEDPQRVMDVLTRAAQGCAAIKADPPVAVAFVGLGDSSIDFMVMGHCESADYLAALHQIRMACYNELNKEGIDIPYPQVVMHNAAS